MKNSIGNSYRAYSASSNRERISIKVNCELIIYNSQPIPRPTYKVIRNLPETKWKGFCLGVSLAQELNNLKNMSTPYYVSPEQIRQDKEDFVRRGIAQAKEVVVLEYQDGLLMVAENPRKTIYKISEIYDRIALAAAGRIAEYEALRVAGIRESEIKGFRYYREDVTAKWLTNLYSQHMGAVAQAWDAKPLEIELLVCEVGITGSETAAGLQRNQIYHIAFDGIYSEEEKYAVIGGRATAITEMLEQRYTDGLGDASSTPPRDGDLSEY